MTVQDKQPDKEVTAPADFAAAVKQPDKQQIGAAVHPVAETMDRLQALDARADRLLAALLARYG